MSGLNVQLFRGRSKRKCGLWIAVMLRRKISLLARAAFFKALAEPEGVETRQVQQGQEGCNKQTAHDGDRHRAPERGTRQRDHRQDRGERRQHHRAGGAEATQVALWSARITALRMIMPASAINPSSATKPNGWLATFSPSDAPMMPSGAVRNTSKRREKLCSWIIRSGSMTMTISGNSTKIDALPLADSSNAPPFSIR